MATCKICGEKTEFVFAIKFKPIPICNNCARVIMLQEVAWLAQNTNPSGKGIEYPLKQAVKYIKVAAMPLTTTKEYRDFSKIMEKVLISQALI